MIDGGIGDAGNENSANGDVGGARGHDFLVDLMGFFISRKFTGGANA